ncbi:MAG: hypothetical protein DHS20C02_08120 [Micavibrio sp.]|nr:MAG: hypothetical protein DHS20C02_08120 [Micavibrio sp.]
MSEEDNASDGNYPTCTVKCKKSGDGCKKTCCKENSPTHATYGIHVCEDHK